MMSKIDVSGMPAVSTSVNYVRRMDPPPRIYYVERPACEPFSTVELEAHPVAVHSVIGSEYLFDLSEHGMCFLGDWFPFEDFENREAVRAELCPKVEGIAQQLTGAHRVIATDFGVRKRSHGFESSQNAEQGARFRQVADMAHCDYTPYSASLPLNWTVEDGEALSRGHYAIYNFWWPVRGPLHDFPLALCLTDSLANHDYVELRTYFDRRGPTPVVGLSYHPDHKWVYKPGMAVDEVMVFRTWDSARPLSDCVPHVAVKDPTAPPDAPARESFEMRVVALFEP